VGIEISDNSNLSFSAILSAQLLRWQSGGHVPVALKVYDLLKTEKYRKLLDVGIEIERRMPETLRIGFIDDLRGWISSGQASSTVLTEPEMEQAYQAVCQYVNRGNFQNTSLDELARILFSKQPALAVGSQMAITQDPIQKTRLDEQRAPADRSNVIIEGIQESTHEKSSRVDGDAISRLESVDAPADYSALVIGGVVMLQILVIYFSIFR